MEDNTLKANAITIQRWWRTVTRYHTEPVLQSFPGPHYFGVEAVLELSREDPLIRAFREYNWKNVDN